MRYDVFNVLNRVVKKRFVMLLINLKNCRTDECEKISEEVKRSYAMIVSRDKREDEINCFDFEVISAYDIDFRDVVNEKINEETNEETDEKKKEINAKDETNEVCFFV